MTLRVTCQKLTATRSGPMYSNLWSGKSFAVTTALTPGSAAAFEVSIERMRACACGERRILPIERAGHRVVGGVHRPAGDLRHAVRTDRPGPHPFVTPDDIVHGCSPCRSGSRDWPLESRGAAANTRPYAPSPAGDDGRYRPQRIRRCVRMPGEARDQRSRWRRNCGMMQSGRVRDQDTSVGQGQKFSANGADAALTTRNSSRRRAISARRRGSAADRVSTSPPGRRSSAVVKWFKSEKGFGFVELSDGSGDAFLHATVLGRGGVTAVSRAKRSRCGSRQGQRGPQVTEVLNVDTSTGGVAPRPPRTAGGGFRPAGRRRSAAARGRRSRRPARSSGTTR